MKVRIYTPVTQAGKRHVPGPQGIELDVAPHDAEFLKKLGVLDKPAAIKPVPAAAEPIEDDASRVA